jgi:hypothetical protein
MASEWVYLRARTGAGEENTGGLAGKSAGRTGVAKAGEGLNEALDQTFLAKTSVAQGRQGDEKEGLGLHFEEWKRMKN